MGGTSQPHNLRLFYMLITKDLFSHMSGTLLAWAYYIICKGVLCMCIPTLEAIRELNNPRNNGPRGCLLAGVRGSVSTLGRG